MRDLDGLARIADEQLAPGTYRALVHAQHAELAHVRVDGNLEHMRNHVPRRVCGDWHALGVRARALQKGRWVALGRVRHEPLEHPQQLCDPRAALGRGKAHRHQVPLAQRLLERVVQLLGRDLLALLQVKRHEPLIELDHLVDDLRVRRLDRGEVGRPSVRLEEAVHHRIPAPGRQVERQALAAKVLAQLLQHFRAVRILAVDLVDDDEAAQVALARELHETLGKGVHAARGAHHHDDRLDRLQYRERLAESMRLMCTSWQSKLQMAVSSECCRRFSCGSKSDTVVPRARLPRLRVTPACRSSVSSREVLPAPACPTSAIFRIPAVVYPMAKAPGFFESLLPMPAPGPAVPGAAAQR